jgi:hypothetical protein
LGHGTIPPIGKLSFGKYIKKDGKRQFILGPHLWVFAENAGIAGPSNFRVEDIRIGEV